MAYSQVNICNIALMDIGAPVIASMTEDSDAAELLNVVWEYARKQCIEDIKPAFAMATAQLAQDATYEAAPTDPKYDHRYSKPASCLHIREVVDANDSAITDYKEETDYIYSNTDNSGVDLYVRYIVDITDVTKWSGAFINCMVARLKSMVCRKLAAMNPEQFHNEYAVMRLEAIALNQSNDYIEGEDGNEDWVTRRTESDAVLLKEV